MQNNISRDLIISTYTNYNWDQIKYWVNSIKLSGFNGDIVVIVYNSDQETVKKLTSLGINCIVFLRDSDGNYVYPRPFSIVVQRFYDMWYYLTTISNKSYRYVIATDIKDVIFQKNPINWLEKHLTDKAIVASSEGIKYIDEPWGNENLYNSFPLFYDSLKTNIIYNCGVQAGKFDAIVDLWHNIFYYCNGSSIHNPDQAAYNLLLNTFSWKNHIKHVDHTDSWACQAGTVADPLKIESFRSKLVDPEPLIINDQICNVNLTPYTIVHQWDRVPEWTQIIEKRYSL